MRSLTTSRARCCFAGSSASKRYTKTLVSTKTLTGRRPPREVPRARGARRGSRWRRRVARSRRSRAREGQLARAPALGRSRRAAEQLGERRGGGVRIGGGQGADLTLDQAVVQGEELH